MPQDAFTISYITKELKAQLIGGKISRIVQPSRDELTFIIYTGKRNVKLEACLSAQSSRLSLTDDDRPVPVTAPNFCMLLRKHLQNAEILDIVQPDFERIIYFDLLCTSDFSSSVMRLYFEIMGKYSNAVLTENGVIVGALKTTSIGENTKRVLFGGVKYTPPEPQDKIPPDDIAAIQKINFSAGDTAKIISDRVKGIAYTTALEMVNTFGEEITARNIYDYVFTAPTAPCVTYSDGEPVLLIPIQKAQFRRESGQAEKRAERRRKESRKTACGRGKPTYRMRGCGKNKIKGRAYHRKHLRYTARNDAFYGGELLRPRRRDGKNRA